MIMLPTGMMPGLLSPEQEAAVKQQAQQNALLNFGLQALAGSQGVGYRPGTLQVLGQAGQSALQSYQGTFDQQLQNMLRQQQMADAQRKREQEMRAQSATRQFQQMFAPTTPETALAAPGRIGPTAERAGMIGQTPALDRNQLLAQVLNPDLPPDLRASAAKAFEVTAPVKEERAPGDVGEFIAATAAGLVPPGTTLMQYRESKRPPGTTVNIGGENEFRKEIAKAEAKDFAAIKQSGFQAQRSARDINRLDTYLSKIETGGAAAFKQAAGNFGINTEGLNEIQAAQAIINKLVPAQRPPGSGTMSDADLALYKESLPRIINQPGANKEIVRSMKEINNYLIEEGKIAAEVTAGRITPEEGTRRIFALGNPVQEFFDRTQQSAPRGPVRATQEDQSLILKYLQPGR